MSRKSLLYIVGFFAILGLVGVGLVLFVLPDRFKQLLFPIQLHDNRSAREWASDLKSDDLEVRKQAIRNLGIMSTAAKDHLPALARLMLEDGSREVRIESALAISKMAPDSKAVLNELIQATKDDEAWVRRNAIQAMFVLKQDAAPAVPALIAAVKDPRNDTNLNAFHLTVQDLALLALGRASAGTTDGLETLMEAVNGKDEKRWAAASRALGEVGEPARGTIPRLRELTKHERESIYSAAYDGLEALGEKATRPKPQPGKKMNPSNSKSSGPKGAGPKEAGEIGPVPKELAPKGGPKG